MEAHHGREGETRFGMTRKAEPLRAALLRTYEEAEHARGCAFWQGRECDCFLVDVARALGRDRRV